MMDLAALYRQIENNVGIFTVIPVRLSDGGYKQLKILNPMWDSGGSILIEITTEKVPQPWWRFWRTEYETSRTFYVKD